MSAYANDRFVWAFSCKSPEPFDATTAIAGSLERCLRYLEKRNIYLRAVEDYNKLHVKAEIPIYMDFLQINRCNNSIKPGEVVL